MIKFKFFVLLTTIIFIIIYPCYLDYYNQKVVESIEWGVSGGDGLYTSKDKKYQLKVYHPWAPTIGDKGDSDGFVVLKHQGELYFIQHPTKSLMFKFRKR